MNKIKELIAEFKPLDKMIVFAAVLAVSMSVGSYISFVATPSEPPVEEVNCCADPQSLIEIDGITSHFCYPIRRSR